MKVALYLHMHQPWRLARFRYMDLGSGRPYIDRERNLAIFRGIAERSYRPTLDRLLAATEQFPEFRFSLSITGSFVEQAAAAAPDVLTRVAKLVRSGHAALVGETYYHSLAFLLPPPELAEEVERHAEMLEHQFGRRAKVLRMTELAFSDDLARFAESRKYAAMLAEGWEGLLGDQSPNYLYCSSSAPTVRLLLRNYRLSDDVGFRFSSKEWNEYPLLAEKYVRWLGDSPGDIIGLFLDFETFGEHHHASTGILDFLTALPAAAARDRRLQWATVEDALELAPVGTVSAPMTVSWADAQRDLGAWLGNDLQRSAFEAAKKLGAIVRQCGEPGLIEEWRWMLTSDHFYYMYVSGHGADADVHRYFSSYGSPYDAYANYMNALTDLRRRALAVLGRPEPPAPRGSG
ncbi:MAG: glycoside hydrolase family 57 protein [Thermoplasmata archaeon]|nr:glycoside hydrolase family 57 protein [Thermoplasmata archaeon]